MKINEREKLLTIIVHSFCFVFAAITGLSVGWVAYKIHSYLYSFDQPFFDNHFLRSYPTWKFSKKRRRWIGIRKYEPVLETWYERLQYTVLYFFPIAGAYSVFIGFLAYRGAYMYLCGGWDRYIQKKLQQRINTDNTAKEQQSQPIGTTKSNSKLEDEKKSSTPTSVH
jgi:hypothetical protein